MSYLYDMIELLAPGDVYVSEKQTLQFHKGMSYEIKNVYHTGGKLIATITDKWGKEVWFIPSLFKNTAKTHMNQCHRHLMALLNFWFDHNRTFTYWKGWKNPSQFYSANMGMVYSSRGQNIEGSVGLEMKFRNDMNEPWKTVSTEPRLSFLSKKACLDHYFEMLKGSINEDFYAIHLDGLNSDTQDPLNNQTYILMNGINTVPQDKMDELSKTLVDNGYNYKGKHYGQYELSYDEYISYLNELIFDNKIPDTECKKHVQEIINLYVAVPATWAATACANVLLGKGKVKNATSEPFWEKFVPLGLKMPQVFEFVDHVSTYLYHTKVFKTKEDYSSGTEWRNQFEFIGSKYIDKTKLAEYLK